MRRLALLMLCLPAPALSCSAQAPADLLGTLDGTFSATEQTASTRLAGEERAVLFVREEGPFLVVIVRAAEALDVASLCVATSGEVHVLHASAALGRVMYTPDGATWTTDDAFAWALRDPSMTEAVRQARQAYLDAHGWVATTMRMGTPGEVEFLLRRDAFPPDPLFLAAGLMPSATPEIIVGLPAAAAGPCALYDLVAGSPPAGLSFQPDAWIPLTPEE